MKTKAETLKSLFKRLKNAKILNFFYFTVAEYRLNPDLTIKRIIRANPKEDVFIVRSSALDEDKHSNSNAGKYKSELNVRVSELKNSIEEVIKSYGKRANLRNQILVQPMLKKIGLSGVVFTSPQKNNSPYFVINYSENKNVSSITSGIDSGKTFYIFHNTRNYPNKYLKRLVLLSKELISKINNKFLDIEFAFTKNNELILFQVRSLKIYDKKDADLSFAIKNIKKRFIKANINHPDLLGNKTIFGIMPDWNPAEIIGLYPRPLSLSLYKELITDGIWAYQRDNYGYRKLRSFPLLIDLMGLPYVDVRVSFNSFIPKSLPNTVAEKLSNYYLKKLEKKPFLHDKIEFDIVFSCFTFSLDSKLKKLSKLNFSSSEILQISNSLKKLTNSIINSNDGIWKRELVKINKLEDRLNIILNNKKFDLNEKIYWLVEDCKRYGTLPFAGLARAGFIAMQILDSLHEENVITDDQKNMFLNSLETIGSRIKKDFLKYKKKEFLNIYGHLRPGTYDILSPRYDENPENYFNWRNKEIKKISKKKFLFSKKELDKIELLLRKNKINISAQNLIKFIRSAIESRELAKFLFTKHLSAILKKIKELGEKYMIKLEDLSYLDIKDLIHNFSTSWNQKEIILNSIKKGKKRYAITEKIILPPLIKNEKEIENFEILETRPNFITKKKITAKTLINITDLKNIKDSIVFIPSADPGYDWLFTQKISGFITAYGGVNSHMSIRASELKIPAVIGSGELLYKKWSEAKIISLDCANQFVKIVT